MKSLPPPIHLSLDVVDRLGQVVTAHLTAATEARDGKWVWHAIFPDTGEPPAEILGSSASAEAIAADLADRVSRLQMIDALAEPPGDFAQ